MSGFTAGLYSYKTLEIYFIGCARQASLCMIAPSVDGFLVFTQTFR